MTTTKSEDELDEIRECLRNISPETLAEGMIRLRQAREAELAKRLKPYQTSRRLV